MTTPRHLHLHSRAFLKERSEKTLDHAKRYLALGWVIVKTHAPIFSETGELGCTCEEYYRSDKCRDSGNKQYDPNYVCPNPGKHPVGKWKHETTGVTLDQIHDVWGRFHSALDVRTGKRVKIVWNMGKLTGPSNSLVFDEDSYKEHYQCELSDLMTLEEQETPMMRTHSGGVHLEFDRENKPYTNANGELAKAGVFGVDIRGVQGFEVLAPSIGYTGNEYAWEEGFEPWTVKARPIPAALDAILRTAAEKRSRSHSVGPVQFTTPTTQSPNLNRWRISKDILDLISHPRPKGQRSEADHRVCLSLCYAGATDDDILAVFEHNPIGADGKFAEAGRVYLAHTITNARSYAAEHPRPDVSAIIAHYRHLAEFGDWSKLIPIDRQSANGYLTGPWDRKLFPNLLDIMERVGRTTNVIISYRRLITRVDSQGNKVALVGGIQTAKAFLDRLNGVMLTYKTTKNGTEVSLIDPVVTTLDTSNQQPNMIEVSNVVTTGSVCAHLADDAFATGTARWAREVIDSEKKFLMTGNPDYQAAAIAYKSALASKPKTVSEMRQLIGTDMLAAYQELCEAAAADFLPGLGTFGLLVVVDLLENPGSDRQCIAERRGLKPSSVSTVLRKLERWDLVNVEQSETFGARKYYTLVSDAFGEIAERLPEAKTHKIGVQRMESQLQKAQQRAEMEAHKAMEVGDIDAQHLAEKRINRIAQHRFKTVPVLYPNLSESEVARFIYAPSFVPEVKPKAPAMPEPGTLAWYRLTELTGKKLLTADEYGELQALDRVLGAGVDGRHGMVEYDRPSRW